MNRPTRSQTKPSAPSRPSRPDAPAPGKATAHISPTGGSRKAATQARARETVDAILEAAASILERDGYRAASTNAIVRKAGVSVGSLYQYFASREDIFRTLAARHRSGIHPLIEGAMARMAAGADRPSLVLTELVRDLLEAHSGRPVLMHALETDLARVLPPERIMEEAAELEAATRLLASRIARPPDEALACAWLATELTALVSRKLAHDAPDWVEVGKVQEAFAQVMENLVG